MYKKVILIGTSAGILLLAYYWGSNWFMLSLNYWELLLTATVLLFALAGGAYVRFTQNKTQADAPMRATPELALPLAFKLSPREEEVLTELLQGKSNKQIAEKLFISESTVKTHVSKLLEKFDAKSRTQIMHKVQLLYGDTLGGKA